MLVNNKKLSEFGGKLLGYSLGGSAVTNDYLRGPSCLAPVLLHTDIGLRPLTVTITFEGEDREDTIAKISAFACEVQSKSELWLPDGFTYTCILTSISEVVEILPNYQEVSYSFDAVQHKELVTHRFSSGTSHTVFCQGNLPTECILSVTPATSLSQLMVFGIKISSLTAGKTFVIDGIARTVTQDGINKFAQTNLVEFPKLQPGSNLINLSQSVPLTVSYYPTFI